MILNNFGTVSPEHEKQLRLTLYELRSIHELGTLQRFEIRIDQQAPTAVHAWGSHFYGCRCGCRKTGLSLERLQRDGIHVLLIPIEGATKHMGMQLPHMRYPSGAECALLNGLTPNLMWGQDARLGLCLVGQLASPLQSAWILTHVRQHLMHRGLLPHSKEGPSDVLAMQRTRLLAEAEKGGFFKFPDNGSTASLAPVGETPYPAHSSESMGGCFVFHSLRGIGSHCWGWQMVIMFIFLFGILIRLILPRWIPFSLGWSNWWGLTRSLSPNTFVGRPICRVVVDRMRLLNCILL